MNLKNMIFLWIGIFALQSCSTTKNNQSNNIYWISGTKTDCVGGAGKRQCLNVYKGEDLNNANWEHFYASIEGFDFEEGYMKKIEVKEEKLDAKNVPADASSIKYTLVKELEKQPDYRSLVSGNWSLTQLNDAPINKMVVVPTMEIDLNQMRVSGNSGCNNYSGQIKRLSPNTINWGNIVSTKKACITKNIEQEFNQAMSSVNTYQIKGDKLIFYDQSSKKMLSFMKKSPSSSANQELSNQWFTTRINGDPINRMNPIPRMEINLSEMMVTGNDGCNNYRGDINTLTDTQLVFGNIAGTKKMCRIMDAADSFNQAINKVASYKLEDSSLIFMDSEGNEILAFLKDK